MLQTEAATVIRRPLRTVFPFVADAENTRRFRPDIVAVTRTSGTPTAVGATYHQVVKFAWREVDVWLENTEYEPERKLSFTARKPDAVTVKTAFTFQTIELAHTRVEVSTESDAHGFSRLTRYLQKQELEALQGLKRDLESRPPGP